MVPRPRPSEQSRTVEFVGAFAQSRPPIQAAEAMRRMLEFDLPQRTRYATWTAALAGLAERAEEAGVLVMASGIVGSNTHRKLDPGEFRGFSLADPYAPVVFVNAADTKAAQIFTLAHELAHIGLGQTALDDATAGQRGTNEVERWCNDVAAELLVPLGSLRLELDPDVDPVVELERVMTMGPGKGDSGGDFSNTIPVRTGKRFARALVTSTLEGQTLYRDAARLLGFKKLSTLDGLAERLGVT